jgi:hypothetical protein
VRWLGNDLGERRTGGVSPCHRQTVEAAEHFVFAVPQTRDRTGTGDVGLHAISRDKTTAGCGLRYGNACPWTVCRRHMGQ